MKIGLQRIYDKEVEMKAAYICSPFRGAETRNIEYAKEITRAAIKQGYAPITPHLYITKCLNDRIPEQRERGISVGIALLDVCEIVIVGTDYGISDGMQNEIKIAKEKGIQVAFVTAKNFYILPKMRM